MSANVFAVLDLRHPHGFSVSRHPSITRETVEFCLRQRNSEPVGHVLPAGPFKKNSNTWKETNVALFVTPTLWILSVSGHLPSFPCDESFSLTLNGLDATLIFLLDVCLLDTTKNTNRNHNKKSQRRRATALRTVLSANGPCSFISLNWMIRSLAKMAASASIRTLDSACGNMSPSIVSCPSVNWSSFRFTLHRWISYAIRAHLTVFEISW